MCFKTSGPFIGSEIFLFIFTKSFSCFNTQKRMLFCLFCSAVFCPYETKSEHIYLALKVKVKSLSHVWPFATPWTVAHQVLLSMGFFRQEYCSGLPFPSPGNLPNPGIEPRSPALQADTLTSYLALTLGKSGSPLISWSQNASDSHTWNLSFHAWPECFAHLPAFVSPFHHSLSPSTRSTTSSVRPFGWHLLALHYSPVNTCILV